MELAIQATMEILENLGHQGNRENEVALGFQELVTPPCVIKPTTSGNFTAKDPKSNSTGKRLTLMTFTGGCSVSLLAPTERFLHWRQMQTLD